MEETQEDEGEEERQILVSDENGDVGPRPAVRLLRLGKKVAIAAAAVASAPALIPPLALGLAFAFPFGAYYAAFAFTNNVMKALLVSPPLIGFKIPIINYKKPPIFKNPYHLDADSRKLLLPQDKERETETGHATVGGIDEKEGSRALVTAEMGKKEISSTEEGRTQVDIDEPSTVISGHEIEISGEGYSKRRSNCTSTDGADDIVRDMGRVEEKGPTQASRGEKEDEESGEREENSKGKGTLHEQSEEGGRLDYRSSVSDMLGGGIHMDSGEREINIKVDEETSAEVQDMPGFAIAIPDEKQHPQNIYPPGGLLPKESSSENEGIIHSLESASNVGNEQRPVLFEVRRPDIIMEGREDRMVDEIQDVSSAAVGAKELLPAVHDALSAVPEESEVDFRLPHSSTENGGSAESDIDGSSTEELKGEVLKGKATGERNEADKVKANEEEDRETTQSNNILMAVLTVKCESVVEQYATEKKRNETEARTLGSTSALRNPNEVMEDKNVEDGSKDVNLNREEQLMTTYYSTFSGALFQREIEMDQSCLTMDYVSVAEVRSSDLTDAESRQTAAIGDAISTVNSDDEALYSEEIIWEQINAIRMIIGCKTALCSSLAEELKALYLFTGVEPPVYLQDTSDFSDIGEMLKFLKLVIGVK